MKDVEVFVKSVSEIKTKGKKCNCCGKTHYELPENTKTQIWETKKVKKLLIFFDCECKSTLAKVGNYE